MAEEREKQVQEVAEKIADIERRISAFEGLMALQGADSPAVATAAASTAPEQHQHQLQHQLQHHPAQPGVSQYPYPYPYPHPYLLLPYYQYYQYYYNYYQAAAGNSAPTLLPPPPSSSSSSSSPSPSPSPSTLSAPAAIVENILVVGTPVKRRSAQKWKQSKVDATAGADATADPNAGKVRVTGKRKVRAETGPEEEVRPRKRPTYSAECAHLCMGVHIEPRRVHPSLQEDTKRPVCPPCRDSATLTTAPVARCLWVGVSQLRSALSEPVGLHLPTFFYTLHIRGVPVKGRQLLSLPSPHPAPVRSMDCPPLFAAPSHHSAPL